MLHLGEHGNNLLSSSWSNTAYSHADTEANEIHTINHFLHFDGGT